MAEEDENLLLEEEETKKKAKHRTRGPYRKSAPIPEKKRKPGEK